MRRKGPGGGWTALHGAESNKIAKMLLEHGADINARNDK